MREIVSVPDHDGFSDVPIDVEEPSASQSPEVMIERAAAMWILKTKEKYRIPQSSIESMIQDVQGFLQLVLGHAHSTINDALSESSIHTSAHVASVFSHDSIFCNPFQHLQTQYLQHKYFRENFDFLVSIVCSYACNITLTSD